MKISGYICIRNAIELDYCFTEAVCSLIPVCDEVVICEGESTDGTLEECKRLERMDSRVRVITYPWKNPVADIKFYTDWINYARERLRFPMQLNIDGDEVLCPGSYPMILKSAAAGASMWFHRLNFWKTSKIIAPWGRVCGHAVARLGPTELWMPSDEPHPEGEPEIRLRAGWPPAWDPTMRMFHYGYIRNHESLLLKVKVIEEAFFGTCDKRVAVSRESGTHILDLVEMDRPFLDYTGDHPSVAHDWLRARGHSS